MTMVNKRASILLVIFSLTTLTLYAQESSSSSKQKTIEKIMNLAINSVYFDSIYKRKRVYFQANELLGLNSVLNLKKNGKPVIITQFLNHHCKKQYSVLGSFTSDFLTGASVQFQIMPDKTLLNLYAIKTDGFWKIMNYSIVLEE